MDGWMDGWMGGNREQSSEFHSEGIAHLKRAKGESRERERVNEKACVLTESS